MQIHKILQYSPYELTRIATYRIIYRSLLFIREHNRITSYDCINGYIRYLPQELFKLYSEYVVVTDKVIEDANKIVNGFIFLFEKWNDFNYETDWLKDPKTGLFWDDKIYAINAPFVHSEYADVKYVLETNKLNSLVKVAQAYYISKDNKYIEFISFALRGWKKCVPPECSVVNRIVMDIAYRAINLIHISILCWNSELFHREVEPSIIGILLHHEDFMWSRLGPRWFKSNNDNNHTIGELIGIYVTQLFLNSVIGKDFSKKLDKESKFLLLVLKKIVAKSGAYIEQSGNYTKVVAEFLMLFEMFIKSYNINTNPILCYSYRNYLGSIVNYMLSISYDGIIDNFGDNDGAMVLIPFENNTYSFEHLLKFAGVINNDLDFLDASQCVYNSSNNDRIHIFIRVGKFAYYVEGAYIHAHNDILSILLCAKGSRIFIDKGCYYYNSGLDTRREYVCLDSHNNVSIDGLDLSDLLPTGNKSYPISGIKSLSKTDELFNFIGFLKYKNIIQYRNISYLNSSILIYDKINVTDNIVHVAKVSYLLGPDIIAEKKDNLLFLCDIKNGNKFIFGIDECMDIEVKEESYYPTYGKRERTFRLIAKIKFQKSLCLTTRIHIM